MLFVSALILAIPFFGSEGQDTKNSRDQDSEIGFTAPRIRRIEELREEESSNSDSIPPARVARDRTLSRFAAASVDDVDDVDSQGSIGLRRTAALNSAQLRAAVSDEDDSSPPPARSNGLNSEQLRAALADNSAANFDEDDLAADQNVHENVQDLDDLGLFDGDAESSTVQRRAPMAKRQESADQVQILE